MGTIYLLDIMLFVFTIYTGIFLKKAHTTYPDMSSGFHIWEICFNAMTWNYGNNFAGNLSIILGIIFFGVAFPITLIFDFERLIMVIIVLALFALYLILLFVITKLKLRKKFNLKK
ncbi:MAG: hypothetical protein Q4B36_00605 [Tissierellia bacterium]|nr:hypothetical protein [Tissierellia bacterium]